jgi:hypothetical protein
MGVGSNEWLLLWVWDIVAAVHSEDHGSINEKI